MKKFLLIFTAGCIIMFASVSNTTAQNFCKTDPSFNKVLVDNDQITATEVTFEPGKKTTMHTHPASFIYALTDGTLFIKYADGATETFELKAGDSAYQEPDRPHMTVNNGNKAVKILLIEMKDRPYLPEGKMKK